MAEYRLEGESFLQALPVEQVDAKEFCGVMVYRLCGTRIHIDAAASMLHEAYPHDKKEALSDAKWLGKINLGTPDKAPLWLDLYELIIMREVAQGDR